jgi:hypothetical protein
MKFRAMTLAVLTTVAATALAQQPPFRQTGQGNGQGRPRTQAQPQYGSTTEKMVDWMRRTRDSDPARSMIHFLMKRNDVQAEIGLDTRQKEALETNKKKQKSDGESKVSGNEFFLTLQKKLQDIGQLPLDQQEAARAAAMAELKEQGQKLAESLRGDAPKDDADYEKVLRPQQMERLYQLDGQWRGPMALADPKLKENFQLSDDQAAAIIKLVAEFRDQQRSIMEKALGEEPKGDLRDKIEHQGGVFVGNDGSGETQVTAVPRKEKGSRLAGKSETEIQNRYDVAKREWETLRKKYGDLTLKVLSPEQRDYWFKVLGRQFSFRAND